MVRKAIFMLIIILLLPILSGFTPIEANIVKDKVLILNSYNKGLKWTDDIVSGVEEVLGNSVDLRTEYMDTKMSSDKEYYSLIYNILRHKYKKDSFKVIILSDDNALNFYLEYGKSLFGNTPVVFCGINDYENVKNEIKSRRNMTGIREVLDIEKTIEIATSLHSEAKNIFVLSDSRFTGRVNEKEVKDIMYKFEDRVDFIFSADMSLEEIKEKIDNLDSSSIILYLSYVGDNDGDYYHYEDLADFLFKNSKAPVYSVWDFFIDRGIIGGMMTSGEVQGELAGQLANRIISGENPWEIEVISEKTNRAIFDNNLIEKFNINSLELPAEAVIVNKPSSFYKDNKEIVLTTLFFIIILIGIIIILLKNIGRRKEIEQNLISHQKEIFELNQKLEKRVEERTKDLQTSNEMLKNTLENLKKAQVQLVESEKMASLGNLVGGVAHEINTPLGICITAITYFEEKTMNIIRDFKGNKMKKSTLIEYLDIGEDTSEIVYTNLQKASNLIKSFKKVAVDQSTMERRSFNVKSYLEEILLSLKPEIKKTKIDIEINCEEEVVINIPPGDFYQVVTNLIINTIRHGYGKQEKGRIEIYVKLDEVNLVLDYRDYGKGIDEENLGKIFDPFFTTARSIGGSGLGLNIVYNVIVQKLKGNIECNSKKGKGTQFIIKIPKGFEEE